MAREQNPSEVQKEMIEVLGSENGSLFYGIQNDFIFLVEKFKHFKELYMKDQSRIELMKDSAPFFFYSLQRILIDDLVMNISRLSESDKKNNEKYQNATLTGFIKNFKPEELNRNIYKNFNTSLKCIKNLNDWRDKKVAHRDSEIHVNDNPLFIKYDDIESCIGNLKELMRSIHRHFFKSDFLYDLFTPTGGAMALLNSLDRSNRCKIEYFSSKREKRQFNIDVIRPGNKSFN